MSTLALPIVMDLIGSGPNAENKGEKTQPFLSVIDAGQFNKAPDRVREALAGLPVFWIGVRRPISC
jgi:hypothetical protein